MEKWQLQDAKNRFSEVVEKSLRKGPQLITRRGVETAVVMSVKEYQKLIKPKKDLVQFFRNSPLKGIEIDLERKKDLPREIDF